MIRLLNYYYYIAIIEKIVLGNTLFALYDQISN